MSDGLQVLSGGQPRLLFSEQIVDRAYNEAQTVNILTDELPAMQDGNATLVAFRTDLIIATNMASAKRGEDNDIAGLRTATGFTLGHRIVRYAADESGLTLPRFSTYYLHEYATRADNPDILEGDINRDYGHAPAIMDLVHKKLTNTYTRTGAMLLFGFFRDWANPDREPDKLPAASPHHRFAPPRALTPQRRSQERVARSTSGSKLSPRGNSRSARR